MRAIPLLCGFVLAASLLCGGSDEKAGPENAWLLVPSGKTGYSFTRLQNDPRMSVRLLRQGANLQRRSENRYCLMLRTYIVVRDDRDSDVTRRDGEIICQPAWKFEVRSATGTTTDER